MRLESLYSSRDNKHRILRTLFGVQSGSPGQAVQQNEPLRTAARKVVGGFNLVRGPRIATNLTLRLFVEVHD
jgi:hypothetical protein